MEALLCIQESKTLSDIIKSVRMELTSAIQTAQLQQAYGKDIQLSFGMIHINEQGSVSQISFSGTDVTDIDGFVVKQALQISDANYFDIRQVIKDSPEEFCFFPIQINGKISMTVLKSSPFFEKKYGIGIHWDDVRVEYASKYIVFYRKNWNKPEVYFSGLFSPDGTAKTLLTKAGKHLGIKAGIFYCFSNARPEIFLHIGQVKRDFEAYHPEKNPGMYNFYYGTVASGVFKFNKQTDSNGKIKVKESIRKSLQLLIQIQHGSEENFCIHNEIDRNMFKSYLLGFQTPVKHLNGDIISSSRILELLNLPFQPNSETLKDLNLLQKVTYEDIPS